MFTVKRKLSVVNFCSHNYAILTCFVPTNYAILTCFVPTNYAILTCFVPTNYAILTCFVSVSTIPPRQLKLAASNYNKIEFNWTSPTSEEIPGITRSFNISWIPMYQPHDLQVGYKPVTKRKRRSIEDNTYTEGLVLNLYVL